MKQGSTLNELAATLTAQLETKKDYLAPAQHMVMKAYDGEVAIDLQGHGTYGVQPIAHDQIADTLNIPREYYKRMKAGAPDLLCENVNTWLTAKTDRKMVRTLDGDIRAVLGERYRRLDNYDLMQAILPVILGEQEAKVESCNVSETKLHIKCVFPNLGADLEEIVRQAKIERPDTHKRPTEDLIQAGLVISNSEVGMGSLKVEPMIYRLVCYNGLIVPEFGTRRRHIGKHVEGDGSQVDELFTNETVEADDKAFWLKVRDIVRAACNDESFSRIATAFAETMGKPMESMTKGVEVLAESHGLRDFEAEGILEHLARGGDATQYGLINAVTRYSQDVDDYERATELESMGGKIMQLPNADWLRIARAA